MHLKIYWKQFLRAISWHSFPLSLHVFCALVGHESCSNPTCGSPQLFTNYHQQKLHERDNFIIWSFIIWQICDRRQFVDFAVVPFSRAPHVKTALNFSSCGERFWWEIASKSSFPLVVEMHWNEVNFLMFVYQAKANPYRSNRIRSGYQFEARMCHWASSTQCFQEWTCAVSSSPWIPVSASSEDDVCKPHQFKRTPFLMENN